MKLKALVSAVFILIAANILLAQEKPDERLATKITNYSGYVRLSDAVSEISNLAGIKTYSGSSRKDWQIRDLPVVVCANDIEIGKLLDMIVKAYYLTLRKELVDGKYVYRINRNYNQNKRITDYINAEEDYKNK